MHSNNQQIFILLIYCLGLGLVLIQSYKWSLQWCTSMKLKSNYNNTTVMKHWYKCWELRFTQLYYTIIVYDIIVYDIIINLLPLSFLN